MPKIHYQEDRNSSLLEGKTIIAIDYGSQGYVHALNLKEPGCSVIVGLYEGSRSWKKAQEQGSEVYIAAEALKKADVIMIPINDEKRAAMCKESIMPNLRPGMILMFVHGLVTHSGQIVPSKNVNVTTIAPEAPEHTVRSEYQRGGGTPCLVAVYQDAIGRTMDMALAHGQEIGGARADILETAFKVKIKTNLFGKQAVLCDGVCALTKAGFETLVGAGYAPENTYFECVHETKLIVDLTYESGFAGICYSISNIAEHGSYIIGPKIVTDKTKRAVKKILPDIQDGSFAKEWLLENQVGCPHFSAMRKNETEQPLEKVGAELRKLYNWNDTDKLINNQLIASATQTVPADLNGHR